MYTHQARPFTICLLPGTMINLRLPRKKKESPDATRWTSNYLVHTMINLTFLGNKRESPGMQRGRDQIIYLCVSYLCSGVMLIIVVMPDGVGFLITTTIAKYFIEKKRKLAWSPQTSVLSLYNVTKLCMFSTFIIWDI